jgi:hypothetical protein
MDREYDRHPLRHSAESPQHASKNVGIIDIGWAVQRNPHGWGADSGLPDKPEVRKDRALFG